MIILNKQLINVYLNSNKYFLKKKTVLVNKYYLLYNMIVKINMVQDNIFMINLTFKINISKI